MYAISTGNISNSLEITGISNNLNKVGIAGYVCIHKISNYLERQASEEDRQGGFDIADYLIQFPVAEVVSGIAKSNAKSNQKIQESFSLEQVILLVLDFPHEELPPKFKYYEKYDWVEL